MKTKFIIVYMLLPLLTIFSQSNKMSMHNLKEQIKNEFNKYEGDFALAFKDLRSGKEILINANEVFHAASTMKTPVMMELFKQSVEGKIDLNDSVLVKNEFKSIVDGSKYSMDINRDSGDSLYSFIGKKVSIRKLIYEMITVSSNLATNILIELADPKEIMKTMKEIGAERIEVLRGVEDIKAFEKGLNNRTTAYDLMKIFEVIGKKEFVNEKICNEMIEILLDQKYSSMIPASLPKNIKVAHKTGSISGVEHDSGLVFLPDGRSYVLVILSKNLQDQEDAKNAASKISKLIYEYLVK